MVTPSSAKGAAFERLIIDYLRQHCGAHLARPRAGAARDLGDVAGIPGWTLEIKCRTDLHEAVSRGLRELALEQANAGTPHGALVVKRRGVGAPERQLFVTELGTALPLILSTNHRGTP
jgi:Holliday junction resolvase